MVIFSPSTSPLSFYSHTHNPPPSGTQKLNFGVEGLTVLHVFHRLGDYTLVDVGVVDVNLVPILDV